MPVELTELPPSKRADATSRKADEGERLLRALGDRTRLVVLDEGGQAWSTRDLAGRLEAWRGGRTAVALVIGGPDGLAPELLARADEHWSLSRLTFPHPLVRLVLIEQLYRAWSLGAGHPYHRD